MTEATSMTWSQRIVADLWVMWRLVTMRPTSLVRWFPSTRTHALLLVITAVALEATRWSSVRAAVIGILIWTWIGFWVLRPQMSMSKTMFCALAYISTGHNLMTVLLPPFESAPIANVLLMAFQIAGLIKMFMVNWRDEMEKAA